MIEEGRTFGSCGRSFSPGLGQNLRDREAKSSSYVTGPRLLAGCGAVVQMGPAGSLGEKLLPQALFRIVIGIESLSVIDGWA